MTHQTNNDLTFEEAFAQLEDIVAQLEAGDLPLATSVNLYERGQTLARLCGDLLDTAELRVRQISDDGSLGPLDG